MIQKLIPRILNMESDESLVKPNEFVDAVNVKIDGEDGVDFGIIKYADGNVIIDFDGTPASPSSKEIVTGFVEDESEDKIYMFCATPQGQPDSIYMVSRIDGQYKMTLLARSSKFDFDKDSLTVGNIVRTYDKSITETGEDSGTGFFGDNDVITDFDPTTIITPSADEGEDGFVELTFIPNVNQQAVIDFPTGGSPFVPNHTVIVQNSGTSSAEIVASYFVDIGIYGESPETYGYIQNSSNINGQSGFGGQIITIPPSSTVVLNFTHETSIASGSFQDGWTWDATLSLESPNGDFLPIYFDWTVELNETTSSRGTPDFGPNPALDAGDFVPVDVLIPTNQSKTYSITHVPGGGDESIPMTGKVSILAGNGYGASHNPDYTYLQYVDPSDGSLVQVDGDQGGSPINFSILAGDTFSFDLILSIPAGVETPYTDQVNLKIEFTDETGGVYPVEGNQTVFSAPVSYEIREVVEIDESNPPILLAIPTDGFEVSYTFPAINAVGGDDFGGVNFIEIGYTISNLGGEGAIAFNIEVTGDTSGGLLTPYIPSVFQAPYVGGTLGEALGGGNSNLTNNFQIIIPEGTPNSPFTEELNFNLLYSPFAANASTTIQSEVDSIGSDQIVTLSITAYQVGAEDSAALIDENMSFLFEATPEFTSVEIRAYHNDRQNQVNQTLEEQFNPNGTTNWETLACNYMQDDFSIKSENQIAISVKNIGNSPMPLPNVRLSNTRMRTSGSLPGVMASGQSGFYITNNSYNQEYVDNDEIWMGYGSIYKGDHPFLQGIPPGAALAAALSSNSQESNQVYSEGYHDAYYTLGWQCNRYNIIDTNSDPADREYKHTENAEAPLGWFSTTPSGQAVHQLITGSGLGDPFEVADQDQYSFLVKNLHGWDVVDTSSPREKWSGWFVQGGGGGDSFNGSNLDAAPSNLTVISDDTLLNPGEIAYMIFNCNVAGTTGSAEIYEALLTIAPPEGSSQEQSGYLWKYLLKGATNANALTAGSPPPPSGRSNSSEGSNQSQGYGGSSDQGSQSNTSMTTKVIKSKKGNISEKSSQKAINRATLKRVDKDGRRY